MDTTPTGPGYARGFSSLEHETAIESLAVRGRLPDWLQGALLRTGPCKFEVGERAYNHWFDGLAMLHRFGFSGGRVSYANRFLRGAAFREAERTGRISYGEFATDPCRTLFGRVAAVFSPRLTDNCNVNVNAYGGEMGAFTETRLPIRFDPDTLETLGVYDYGEQLPGQISIAHPHYDAARGCHYSYILQLGWKSAYRLFSIDAASGEQRIVAELPVDRPAYMHSFGMSTRYLILTEFPLVMNPLRLAFSGRPFIQNYRWEPDRGLHFHVVEKDSGRLVGRAEGSAAFAFHHVNAFEDGDDLVLDMVAYADSTIIGDLYLSRLRAGKPVNATGSLTRFRIALSGSKLGERVALCGEALELPRINYAACAGRRHRFVWGTGTRSVTNFLDSIVKIDARAGKSVNWYEEGCYPGEPVFVSTPASSAEDDGVLLSVVLDSRRGTSFLLVLDAKSLAELARAEVPHHIPFGFHGNYFARTETAAAFDHVRP